MNKRVVMLTSVVVLILLSGTFIYFQKQNIQHSPNQQITPTETRTTPQTRFCKSADLEAIVNLSPGAGNVYGTFTLKNISQQSCEVLGNEFIKVSYDPTVKNITVNHIGQTQALSFTLSPGQTIYSQVHYPNGPQCQSVGLRQVAVTFTYNVSPSDTVTFKSLSENISQVIQACLSPNDITKVQIWNMSSQPITP